MDTTHTTDIAANNKLIAEFMGYEQYKFRSYTMFVFEEDNHRTEIDLHYHSSWDWLMPVVEKIYSLELDIELVLVVRDNLAEANIEDTYQAVVEFINWHNENK